MSAIKRFFRHCPSCGHRFEIALVSKKEDVAENEPWKSKEYALSPGMRKESVLSLDPESPLRVEAPELEEIQEVWYNYRCKRCGHQWSEEAYQVKREPPVAGYKGD